MVKIRSAAFSIVILLFTLAKLPAQPLNPNEWRTYTSMTSVRDLAYDKLAGWLWVATGGGVYSVPISQLQNEATQSFRNSDGLSDNDVTAIALDGNRKVYIGNSTGGIDIYDPATAEIKNVTDIFLSQQFPNRRINQIVIEDSVAYIATAFGLSIYSTSGNYFLETVNRFGSMPAQDPVLGVTLTADSIYVVLADGIAIAPKHSTVLSAPFSWNAIASGKQSFTSIALFHGQVIVGGSDALYERLGNSFTKIAVPDTVSIVSLKATADSLYILDAIGAGRLIATDAEASFTFSTIAASSLQQNVTSMLIEGNMPRVFGFASGGITVESQPVVTGFAPDGLLTNSITDMVYASSVGKLFVTYGLNGVTSFEPSSSIWKPYRTNNAPLPTTNYKNVFYDSVRSYLWLSCSGGGLIRVKLGATTEVKQLGRANGLESIDGTGDFIIMGAGRLDNHGDFIVSDWAYNGKGLLKTTDGENFSGTSLNTPDKLFRPYGYVIQDLDDYYFVATVSNQQPEPYGVIAVPPSGSPIPIPGGNQQLLASAIVNAMVVDQDNGLWCATTSGVNVLSHFRDFQSGAVQFHSRKLPLVDQQIVHALAVDGIGNKWVGTENGVFVLSPDGTDSLAHYTTVNSPLIDNYIIAIAIDNATGEAYIATSKGISRVHSIFRQGASDYSTLKVAPNPILQYGNDPVTVRIDGLVQGSTVKVYSTAGKLVATIDATGFGGSVTWNCRDENNKLLPSGVYVLSANAPNASESGQTKFVLVRK